MLRLKLLIYHILLCASLISLSKTMFCLLIAFMCCWLNVRNLNYSQMMRHNYVLFKWKLKESSMHVHSVSITLFLIWHNRNKIENILCTSILTQNCKNMRQEGFYFKQFLDSKSKFLIFILKEMFRLFHIR